MAIPVNHLEAMLKLMDEREELFWKWLHSKGVEKKKWWRIYLAKKAQLLHIVRTVNEGKVS